MAWWNLGPDDADEMIGDPAVDRLGRALAAFAEARDDRDLPRPTVAGLLASIADALRRKAAVWCGPDQDTPFAALEATGERDDQTLIIRQDPAPEPALTTALIEAFEEISLLYEDVLDRQPRRRELLGVVGFLLGAAIDRYLDAPADLSIHDVAAIG